MEGSVDERNLVRQRLQRHRTITEPQVCTMAGRSWDLLPDVFVPMFTRTAEFFARAVPSPAADPSWRSAPARASSR
ncbi:hypothetical protein ADK46_30625 [Streptomyces rimosus subsp. rimosus]|nr:hypothetical protein ADK46_30625 [Streptomyces rimosus subsp. rimosus]QDA09157.1 hypothetical protein CTZ40_40950 [Streptomyces rimosus]QEV80437.1 hypothetical protein CP984_40905 [Streptomyces rimosus]